VKARVARLWRTMTHGQTDVATRTALRFSSEMTMSQAETALSALPPNGLHGQTAEEWVSMLYAADQIDFLNRAGASMWSADHHKSAVLFFARAASAGSAEGAWFVANASLWLGHVEEAITQLRQIARSGNEYAMAASGLIAFERVHDGDIDPSVMHDLLLARTDARLHRVPGDLRDREYADAINRADLALGIEIA
jgi:hypothetical protein